ncbi:MAG: FHA domain-containing protein [Planctomycetes bacterium]|nr:FHA domain-containing protein [Planctomycetota bacterium]
MSGILTLWRRTEKSATERLLLPPGKYVLGRSSECELVVRDKTVSRRHAEIEAFEETMRVRDLGSSNGIYVDSKRVEMSLVGLGQRVCFGRVAFLVIETLTWKDNSVDSELATGACAEGGHGDVSRGDARRGDTGRGESPNLINENAATQVLSAAQERILALAVDGSTEKHMASRLHLSVNTVHNHIKAIYRAFGVHSRPELLAQLHDKEARSVRILANKQRDL